MAPMNQQAAVACGVGAVFVWLGGSSVSVFDCIGLGVGLWGLSRITGVRSLVWVVVLFLLAMFFSNVPSLLPEIGDFRPRNSPWLAVATSLVASILSTAGIVAATLVTRRRVGVLPVLAAIALALSVGASVIDSAIRIVVVDSHDLLGQIGQLAHAINRGLAFAGGGAAGAAWLVCGLEAPPLSRRPGAGALVAGAVGAMLLVVGLRGLEEVDNTPLFVGTMLTFGIGWLLIAVGLFGAARAGSGAIAYLGIACVALGLLVCPATFVSPVYIVQRAPILGLIPSVFGIGGLALVAAASTKLPLRPLRLLAALLFGGAVISILAGGLAGLLSSDDDLSLRPGPLLGIGALLGYGRLPMLLWAIIQALVGWPPRDAPTAASVSSDASESAPAEFPGSSSARLTAVPMTHGVDSLGGYSPP